VARDRRVTVLPLVSVLVSGFWPRLPIRVVEEWDINRFLRLEEGKDVKACGIFTLASIYWAKLQITALKT